MNEKEIKKIIIEDQHPEIEIAERFANMKTSLLFIICALIFGWFLYVSATINETNEIEQQYKEQIDKRDSVNIHNQIVHEQDSITIYDLSEGGFEYE